MTAADHPRDEAVDDDEAATIGDDGSAVEAATAGALARGYVADKERLLARMRRIEGQARGIHRMIEQDVYCIDILTQISAMTSAVEKVALVLLEDHLSHCVVDAARRGGPEAQEKIEEASRAIARLVKS